MHLNFTNLSKLPYPNYTGLNMINQFSNLQLTLYIYYYKNSIYKNAGIKYSKNIDYFSLN